MNQMAHLIDDLSRLAELDLSRRRLEPKTWVFKEITLRMESVRERLPTAILKHYDLRVAKGKRGAARVQNGTCGGCHLSLPAGQLADMRRNGVALQVCGYCSVFLLPGEAMPVDDEPAAAARSPQPSRRKAKVEA